MQQLFDIAKRRFARSKLFQQMVRSVYDFVDLDKSDSLSINEVYIAVLHLYIEIARMSKVIEPPAWDRVKKLFSACVKPGETQMSLKQWTVFCSLLGEQIACRVLLEIAIRSVAAPILGLLALDVWKRLLARAAPRLYRIVWRPLPPTLLAAAAVGGGSSILAPPLVRLVDRHLLEEARVVTAAPPPAVAAIEDVAEGSQAEEAAAASRGRSVR